LPGSLGIKDEEGSSLFAKLLDYLKRCGCFTGTRGAKYADVLYKIRIPLIDATEIVNDFGDRFTRYRMALTVGQLVALDDGAIFVFTFSNA
jgi:hypothetical protein